MTVLSRGARVRRGGRRPGWVLLTALLVLAMGASSALVFTNRVELLKLAVILALWAAVAGAFVSVLYRRQSDADQSRVRDLKLVYDLQLDREISARREYELTVESQLRRELASELRAQAADEVAALRAELAALRTSLEILFDTDLDHRRALETIAARALQHWARNGESAPVDWVSSDRVTTVPPENRARAHRRIADHRRVRGGGAARRWRAAPTTCAAARAGAAALSSPAATAASHPSHHQKCSPKRRSGTRPRPTASGCPPARPAATGPAPTRRMHSPIH